jgi:hypothetical protein
MRNMEKVNLINSREDIKSMGNQIDFSKINTRINDNRAR